MRMVPYREHNPQQDLELKDEAAHENETKTRCA